VVKEEASAAKGIKTTNPKVTDFHLQNHHHHHRPHLGAPCVHGPGSWGCVGFTSTMFNEPLTGQLKFLSNPAEPTSNPNWSALPPPLPLFVCVCPVTSTGVLIGFPM
jgi:hypothetical protein